METKKTVYNIILSVWNLIKTHCFSDNKMSDEQWELLIQEADKEAWQLGEAERKLYSRLFNAVVEYLGEKK